MGHVYNAVMQFKRRHPFTVGWRLKKNSDIIEMHMNEDEIVKYAFCAQKNDNPLSIIETAVVVITNRRIIIGRKRVVFGYFLDSITPELFNDLKVRSGIFWGKIYIDTAKELVQLSNISKDALMEIETCVTDFMIKEKRKRSINTEEKDNKNK